MSYVRFPRGIAAVMIAPILVLSACSSAAAPVSPESVPPSASESPSQAVSAVTDAESCKAFSDVLTILQNATADFHQGRAEKIEYDGWLALATRVLAIVPTRGEGSVSQDIKQLQSIAPPVSTSAGGSSPIANLEWTEGVNIADHCAAAGEEIQIQGFVGG